MKQSFLTTLKLASFLPSRVADMNRQTICSITEDEININHLLEQITLTSTC